MADKTSMLRFIAVYADYYEDREGTERDMEDIVGEDCGNGSFINEKGTVIPGVWMLYQDGSVPEEYRFSNPFSGPFDRYHHEVSMNFVLVGMDDYSEEEQDRLDKMTSEEQLKYYEEHPIEYRSLTDEELRQCLEMLDTVPVPEKTVFLGGSQTFTELPEEVKESLDFWMLRWAAFVVGDCKGADELMQAYLYEKGYRKVYVYVTDDAVRHNVGNWDIVNCHSVPMPRPHTFEWYRIKDDAMADIADAGLMLWDGDSRGTRENIISLREQGKPVSVFRTHGPWCWEEKADKHYCSISEDSLKEELKRYEDGESSCIKMAVQRCPRAEKELHLKRDESFLLYRSGPVRQQNHSEDMPSYQPFLSFADVLAVIRDELIAAGPTAPKPTYVLEKWASKGDINLSFFRFRDELIEVEPPNEDYHMEQTAQFELEGDNVVSFRVLKNEC